MSSDTDLIKLYSGQILVLAADIPFTDRLSNPQITVKERAPLCGSTVTVDLVFDGDQDGKQVVEFGQDVKACALGQAAASVVASQIIGASCQQILTARQQLSDMLSENGPVPDAPFDGLKVLEPAKEYKNRHASILLSLTAITNAIKQIEAA